MSKRFDEMRRRINADPERRRRIEEKKSAYQALVDLAQMRRDAGMTQAAIADAMYVSQSNVAQIEGAEDIKLSTLAAYVVALGGELRVNAVFPDHPEHNVAREFVDTQ